MTIFTSLPRLMYANTNYNMSISQAIYINIVLFAKLNVSQFAFTFQFTNFMFAKYTAYTLYFSLDIIKLLVFIM